MIEKPSNETSITPSPIIIFLFFLYREDQIIGVSFVFTWINIVLSFATTALFCWTGTDHTMNVAFFLIFAPLLFGALILVILIQTLDNCKNHCCCSENCYPVTQFSYLDPKPTQNICVAYNVNVKEVVVFKHIKGLT